MEPFRLHHFSSMRVSNLYEAISLLKTGNAISYHPRMKKTFFIGTLPNYIHIIWHQTNEIPLHVFEGGFTIFSWQHQIEAIVNTGLVVHRFEIFNFDIDLTFYVYDSILFLRSGLAAVKQKDISTNDSSSRKPHNLSAEEMLRNMMETDLVISFKKYLFEDISSDGFLQNKAMILFKLSSQYKQYGISITNIAVSIHHENPIDQDFI